jgi:hypothetical protein
MIEHKKGVTLTKGHQIGMFEMGSTIAMIVEIPKNNFSLNIKAG